MLDLDDINAIEEKEAGFIVDAKVANVPLVQLPKESTIFTVDTTFSLEDAILYTMNGLYALKEKYSMVYVVLYGTEYIVTLKRYATPVPDDLMRVYTILRNALSKVLVPDKCDIMFGELLARIQSGQFNYVE